MCEKAMRNMCYERNGIIFLLLKTYAFVAHSDSCLIFSCHVILSAKCDSQAGSDSASKKPLMLRTPNGYKCLTCNRVFSQKGEHDTNCWLIYMRQADVKLQPALTVTFPCFGYINVKNIERAKPALCAWESLQLGNSLNCFFACFYLQDPNTKRFKRMLIYYDMDTQYAHF